MERTLTRSLQGLALTHEYPVAQGFHDSRYTPTHQAQLSSPNIFDSLTKDRHNVFGSYS